jgi:hypothetical protein
VGINTFFDGIVNLIAWEELQEIPVMGHGLGGITTSTLSDKLRERIQHLIYHNVATAQVSYCFYK